LDSFLEGIQGGGERRKRGGLRTVPTIFDNASEGKGGGEAKSKQTEGKGGGGKVREDFYPYTRFPEGGKGQGKKLRSVWGEREKGGKEERKRR